MKSYLFLSVLIFFGLSYGNASVSITTTMLPNGTVNTSYSGIIAASGGCTPYVWALNSGTLPPGLSDKPATSTTSLSLTGKPTKAGSYSFTISVMGCGKHVSLQSYKLSIQSAANHVVDLSWKASSSSSIAGYNVYRSPDAANWKKLNPGLVASTLYDDSTVANGSTYYYTVTAVNVTGEESTATSALKVVIP
ncbi:MAG TPA: fibronectin type III domain-containing protein [Candidatus Sulfotelmatobacter sp.]|nr:fibronectin type III domain-containing protein [Candidatus Sulfotelmatobacter sp.]